MATPPQRRAGSTLTLKQVTDATAIGGTTEIETPVGDFQATAEILRSLGLREVRYQENYREEWRLADVVFDIDTWPDLPTFLEIEGPAGHTTGTPGPDNKEAPQSNVLDFGANPQGSGGTSVLELWPGAGSNRRPSDFQSDARTN